MIEIKTRYSPPTNVICKRDGEIVVSHPCTKKYGYEVMQVITDRRYSYYTTYIQIRNACDLFGRKNYICTVENSAGRHSRTIPLPPEGMIIINSKTQYKYLLRPNMSANIPTVSKIFVGV